MKHSKLTIILLYLFFIPLALDIAITYGLIITQGHGNNETNPIFILLGGNVPFTLLFTILLSILMYKVITKWSVGRDHVRWVLVSGLVWGLILRYIAIKNNLYIISHPVPIAETVNNVAYSAANKLVYYNVLVALVIIMPLVLQYLSFLLYRLDYNMDPKQNREVEDEHNTSD
jgi:hypothetical protein